MANGLIEKEKHKKLTLSVRVSVASFWSFLFLRRGSIGKRTWCVSLFSYEPTLPEKFIRSSYTQIIVSSYPTAKREWIKKSDRLLLGFTESRIPISALRGRHPSVGPWHDLNNQYHRVTSASSCLLLILLCGPRS